MEANPTEKQQREKDFCPFCKSPNIIHDYDTGEVVCENCGTVLEEKMTDKGPEWRAFNEEERIKRVRVGSPLTYALHDQGVSSDIDSRNYDAYGRPIPAGRRPDINRLRKLQRRTRVNVKERNLALALANITRWCNHLALPKHVEETAGVVYRKALDQGFTRGREINGLSAASVYLACRQCGVAQPAVLRPLEEVEKASNVPKKIIGRNYRLILQSLNYQSPRQKPENYVSKILNMLGITGQTEKIVYKTLEAAREARLTSGRGPTGIAAAACYIASTLTGERRTQGHIAEVVNVTEVTIRNRFKDLMKKLMFEVYL